MLGLDSAEDAVAAARRNAERNGLKAEFQAANVFDWFNDPARGIEPLWDVIILDPPPFAKSRSALEGALRGYKEINLRAVKRLVPGGLLATYTCSHHMQDAELRQRHRDAVRWDRVDALLGFGGIRIEDDVLVTAEAPEVLTAAIP